jgi:hypothetical protein
MSLFIKHINCPNHKEYFFLSWLISSLLATPPEDSTLFNTVSIPEKE